LFEGVVVGALYSSGSVVGLVGAVILAGHTALETAAVGALYASNRFRAGGAITLVQFSYVAGTVAGLLVVNGVPEALRVAVFALTGGVLLWTGGAAMRHSGTVGRHLDSRTATDVDSKTR
jgi:hypothetical protein